MSDPIAQNLKLENSLYWVASSFLVGFAFAPFSYGFIFIIIWYVLFELVYFLYFVENNPKKLNGDYCWYHLFLILAGLVGFFTGRVILSQDTKPWQMLYKESDWID